MFDSLIKYRYTILVVILLVTLFSLYKAQYIQINADVSQFFSEGDSDYEFYQRIKSEFKGDDQLILIGVRNKHNHLEERFYKRILEFSDSLKTITNITKVTGLADLKYPVKSLFGIIGFPYLKMDDSTGLNFNKIKTYKDFEITESFINKTGDVLFLWLEFEEKLSNQELTKLFKDLDNTRHKFSDLETYLWGREFIDLSFKDILSKEIKSFGIWIFILMCVALLFIFKKPSALLFPVILVAIVIILFLGGMVMLNRPLGTMSNLFPTIILIVGISDVIHFCVKYNIETQKGISYIDATKITFKEIGWTTFITSFTTAVGFFVLCITPMTAMKNFGLESGIIVFLTYLITLILLPIFFLGVKSYNPFAISDKFEFLYSRLYSLVIRILKYPNRILGTYAVLIILGVYGIFLIDTNNHQYSIPTDSNLWENYDFFENNFGGSRNFELVLEVKGGYSLNNPEIFKAVYDTHNYLKESGYLSSVKSLMLYYNAMHRAHHPSDYENIDIIENSKALIESEKYFNLFSKHNYLMNNDKSMFKFMAQMNDLGRNDIDKINQEIYNKVTTLISDAPIEAKLTGVDFLIDKSHEKSISNMLIGLLMAVLIVGITLGLIFRNITLTIIAVILNFVPLVITAGIMGFTNLELRGEITLIFTVGFVIAVDDTIHLISKFQWERARGNDVETAIYLALRECGKAIFATSLILIGGFFILMKSSSIEIFTLGLLVGIIVAVTLTVDLILAPTIILKWFKKHL